MPRTVATESLDAVAELVAAGLTDAEVAGRLGVHRDTVSRHRARLGSGNGRNWRRQAIPPLDEEKQAAVLAVVEKFHGRVVQLLFGAWPSLAAVAATVLTEDEMEAACLYGLVRAAARFDAGKANLTTFAAWWIRNAIQQAIAETRGVPRADGKKRANRPVPHEQFGGTEDGWQWEPPDPKAGDPSDGIEKQDVTAAVHRTLGRIHPRLAEVLSRVVIGGQKLDDAAADMGISRERVRQLREDGIRQFFNQWEEPG